MTTFGHTRIGRVSAAVSLAAAMALSGILLASLPAGAQLPPGGTFTDDNGNTHEGYIEAIAAAGITLGCNPEGTLYCPADPVRRDQMASFLARGFDLPPANQDYFPDDDGEHEGNINRIAAAGITQGLEDGTYDPAGLVTRAQMGSFLARAMELNPIPGDRFSDVSGVHEGNINAIAEAGVTLGCDEAGTLFCPDDLVRRDQMASFLGRALDLEPINPPPPASTTTTTTTTSTTSPPNCDPSYPDFCIPPPPPDLDCDDISGPKPFTVNPPDPHGFDSEGDGLGCESG